MSSGRKVSEQLFSLLLSITPTTREKRKRDFLHILSAYPNNDIDIFYRGNSFYHKIRMLNLFIILARFLDVECCQALWDKIGDARFLQALTLDLRLLGNDSYAYDGDPAQALHYIFQYQPYTFIKKIIDTFHIHLRIPVTIDFSKNSIFLAKSIERSISSNQTLSPEEVNKIHWLADIISHINFNLVDLTKRFPDEFMTFYVAYGHSFPRNGVSQSKSVSYQLDVAKWKHKNKLYYDGLKVIVDLIDKSYSSLEISLLLHRAYSDLAMHCYVLGEEENAFRLWATGLKRFWPSSAIKKSIKDSGFPLLDFLLSKPERFHPLSEGERALICTMMLLEEDVEYLQMRGLAFFNTIASDKLDESKEEKKDLEEVKKDNSSGIDWLQFRTSLLKTLHLLVIESLDLMSSTLRSSIQKDDMLRVLTDIRNSAGSTEYHALLNTLQEKIIPYLKELAFPDVLQSFNFIKLAVEKIIEVESKIAMIYQEMAAEYSLRMNNLDDYLDQFEKKQSVSKKSAPVDSPVSAIGFLSHSSSSSSSSHQIMLPVEFKR